MSNKNIKKIIFTDYTFNTFTNDWMGGDILNGKVWEPHITEFLKINLNSTSTFIDIGSNYGWHSIHSSKMCHKILSFEPQKILFEIQKQNIEDNKIDNIDLFNCGVGEINEIKYMTPINYEDESLNYGDLSVNGNSDKNGEKIEIKKLDSIKIENVDIIKIDVQGYEKFVVLGAQEIIKKHKPIFIVEIESHQLRKFNYNPSELYGLFRDLGYYIFLLDYHYPSDCVCVHKDNIVKFREKNKENIFELIESNNISDCLENGFTEKIYYNDEIKYNSKKYEIIG